MVLLDMSKAFDSISHEILLLKLKDVGASNTCLQWFRSYLSDRQQVVRTNSTLSESLPLGSLSNDNGDGNENVISKYKFALF